MSQMECLEDRQHLAADAGAPTVRLSSTGTLTVTGTHVSEVIAVTKEGQTLRVAVDRKNGASTGARFDFGKVKRINIHGANGADRIEVSVDVRGHSNLWGGRGDDTIITHGRNTRLFGEAGDDTLVSDPVVVSRDYPLGDSLYAIRVSRNFLFGADGNDTFRSRGGDDTIGGGGADDERDRFEPINVVNSIFSAAALPDQPILIDNDFYRSRVALGDIDEVGSAPNFDGRALRVFYTETLPIGSGG